jgi:hypothetical protein
MPTAANTSSHTDINTIRLLYPQLVPSVHPQGPFARCVDGRTFSDMTTFADQRAHPMREPCPACGCPDGTITTRNGQDTVRCAQCQRYCYNAPRSETGRERRSLSTRPDVRPRQRSRIFLRGNFACIMCHRSDVALQIGHLISVHDGRLVGQSDDDLTSDVNLARLAGLRGRHCLRCRPGRGESVGLIAGHAAFGVRAGSSRRSGNNAYDD